MTKVVATSTTDQLGSAANCAAVDIPTASAQMPHETILGRVSPRIMSRMYGIVPAVIKTPAAIPATKCQSILFFECGFYLHKKVFLGGVVCKYFVGHGYYLFFLHAVRVGV